MGFGNLPPTVGRDTQDSAELTGFQLGSSSSWDPAAVIYQVIPGNSPYPKNIVPFNLLAEAAVASQQREVGY